MYPVINQTVELLWKEKETPLKVHIADMKTDLIFINCPIDPEKGIFLAIPKGSQVNLIYTGVNGTIYDLMTTVIGPTVDDQILLYVLKKPPIEKIKKLQRREYFRVPAKLKLDIFIEYKVITVETIDISGGGVKIHAHPMLHYIEDEWLKCTLYIPNAEEFHMIHTNSRIVRWDERSNNKELALAYTDIQHKDRELIIKYCFRREMEFRKKGIM